MKLRLHIIYIVAILLSACSTKLVIKSKQNSIVSVSASPDSLITSMIEPYKIGIDSVMNEVLCFSSIEMTKKKQQDQYTIYPQTLIGNFVTDLCLEMYDSIADICIMNNGGLRSTLPYGNITKGDIYKLMPFDNELVIIELNLLEIFELSKYIIDRSGEPFSGFIISIPNYDKDEIQISFHGNPYYYISSDSIYSAVNFCSGPDHGTHIDQVDQFGKWRILTSDYLANGGDRMSFFNNKEQHKVGEKVRNVIINYCKNNKIINSKIDNRLMFNIHGE
ncbi:5'-nucleotidase C-terminal domain-containing protein [Flavobacteriales bacterium]|nr:5'-nucleotidase C-terminal domain-containing protein [Flavobacteriales bacterium]